MNRSTPEGLPELFIKDIPPASTISLRVTRPEIYYGELANDYVFVSTRSQEIDYPAGDENVYTTYQGRGGDRLPLATSPSLPALRLLPHPPQRRDPAGQPGHVLPRSRPPQWK